MRRKDGSLTMILYLLVTIISFNIISSLAFVAPLASTRHSRRAGARSGRCMARYQFEFDEDFYLLLNVTRSAEKTEIKAKYRKLAREWHPDVFVEKLRFDPESLNVKQLKSYLQQERVGVSNLVEKTELVQKAWEVHRRTQGVNLELAEYRTQVQNRFAMLNEAYKTLSDDELRRTYNLSGDWGIPGLSGKQRKGKKRVSDMGDREEAARVRERAQAAQRDPIQEKVYRRYMQEQAEKEEREATFKKEREERRAREEEERRKEQESVGSSPEEAMSDEEIREANQEKIKAMWGGMFNNMFGGAALGKRK